MSYEEALAAAGAEIAAFETFGSYQGDWIARLADGRYVQGSYGSCSGCDAFEAEFGWSEETCERHRYQEAPADCTDCAAAAVNYQAKLARFGAEYLDAATTREELRARFEKDLTWDDDAKAIIEWLDAQP